MTVTAFASPFHDPRATYVRRRALLHGLAFSVPLALCVGILGVGIHLFDQVEQSMLRSAAGPATLYTKALFEPYVQELHDSAILSDVQSKRLDLHLERQIASGHILAVNIWSGNTIAYSENKVSVGQTRPPTELRTRAWAGTVSVNYFSGKDIFGLSLPASEVWRNDWSAATPIDAKTIVHEGDDEIVQRSGGRPVLEIYAPIREAGTHRIVAVAEVYQIPGTSGDVLPGAPLWTWVAISSAGLASILLPGLLARRTRMAIAWQRCRRRPGVQRQSGTGKDDDGLNARLMSASRRVAETNERYLQRLSADLHDGPVQLVSMSLLRLDSCDHLLGRSGDQASAEAAQDISAVREALSETLAELRHLASGLAPVGIETMSVADVIRHAARKHERRTATPVALQLTHLPQDVPEPLRICVYRIVQEGLHNAFRHAAGRDQNVSARCDGGTLELIVSDGGPGLQVSRPSPDRGQGLSGLRNRVEALGGRLSIESQRDHGTRLIARLLLAGNAQP